MKQFFAAGACALFLGACTITQALQPPAIAPNPIPANFFLTTGPRLLSANITAGGSGIVITRIEVRINRDRDPSRFTNDTPLVFTVPAPLPQAGNVTITVPTSVAFAPAQLVTATWFVDYMLRSGGNDTATVSSTVSTRQACTPANVTTLLTALQTTATDPALFPQTLTSAADIARLATRGFLPSHGFRSFVGQGVAFARVFEATTGFNVNPPLEPLLLLYAPPAGVPAAALNEPLIPDFPYTLIGFAIGFKYDPSGPPVFGCLPREAWFVHEAGWHPADGGFIPQTFTETPRGESNPQSPPVLLPNPLDPRIPAVWHGRIWDVHFFVRPGGVPALAACNPAPGAPLPADAFATSLLVTCTPGFPQAPAVGTPFPPAGFFVRVLPP